MSSKTEDHAQAHPDGDSASGAQKFSLLTLTAMVAGSVTYADAM